VNDLIHLVKIHETWVCCEQLPSQIGTALGSASVRFLLRLAPQATSSIRLNNWLTAVFEEG
jgi:hypothetical protein